MSFLVGLNKVYLIFRKITNLGPDSESIFSTENQISKKIGRFPGAGG